MDVKTVFVLEDNPEVQRVLRSCLQKHEVVMCDLIENARVELSKNRKFDLVILDINLPDGDGLNFCIELQSRPEFADVPIIFLSGKDRVSDKVAGLMLGVEDYITKPFDVLELKTRIELRMSKSQKLKESGQILVKRDLRFDLSRQTVHHVNGEKAREIPLTAFEFKLLTYMARHEEHVLTRNQILEAVWGSNVFIIERTIDSHMSNLRKKIKDSQFTITSVYGQGYRFSLKPIHRRQLAVKPEI